MKKGFTLLEIVVVALVVLVVLAIIIPQYVVNRNEKLRESEARQNLRNIQLSIERFAIDTEGTYPQYLIGGSSQGFSIDFSPSASSLRDAERANRRYRLSDPLLRRGYLDSYPRNPFAGNGKKILKHQAKVGDPLRPGAEGDESGYRFGEDGTIMGNVMAEWRFPMFIFVSLGAPPEDVDSHADFDGYPFYDIWEEKKPKFYLPGEFFYKSNGPIIAADAGLIDANQPIQPIEIDQYVMGVYGSTRNKGLDVLGPEPGVVTYAFGGVGQDCVAWPSNTPVPAYMRDSHSCGVVIDKYSCTPAYVCEIELPSSTGWTKDENGKWPGSPYSVSANQQLDQLSPGNPNGIPDAIVFTLSSH